MSRITPQESYNLAKHYNKPDTPDKMTQALPDDLIQDLKEQFQEVRKHFLFYSLFQRLDTGSSGFSTATISV